MIKGENRIHVVVKNTQGLYGLYLKDITFYDQYVFLLLIPFLLLLTNLKVLFLLLIANVKTLFTKMRKSDWAVIILSFLLFIFVYITYLFDFPIDYRWEAGAVLLYSYLLILYLIFSCFQYKIITAVLFSLAVFISAAALVVFPFKSFSYDYAGHLAYIRYVMENGHAPLDAKGWSFYHPSLYYRTVAYIMKLFNVSISAPEIAFSKSIQSISLLLHVIYCFFSLKTIDVLCTRAKEKYGDINEKFIKLAYVSSACLFLFWPSNFMTSIRIGNDSMFTLFYGISFYFIIRWWISYGDKYFLLALVASALAVWSKTNGLILFGVLGLLLFCKIIKQANVKWRLGYQLMVFIFFLVCTSYYAFGEKLFFSHANSDTPLIVGNANHLGDGLRVENPISVFLPFNPVKFIELPFTSSMNPSKGRDNFWFYLFKTSMFGEFNFNKLELVLLAKIMSLFFIITLQLFLIGFYLVSRIGDYAPLAVSICCLIVSMIFFRFAYPYSCSNDFRYVFPAVLPFAFIVSSLFLRCRISKLTDIGLSTIIFGFVGASIVFQVFSILQFPNI